MSTGDAEEAGDGGVHFAQRGRENVLTLFDTK